MDQEKVNRTDEIEIDLRELFYLLKQKLLIVVAAFVIGGILAGAATYVLIKPTYRASSLLYVVSASNNSVVNLADLQIGTNLTADYEELLLSRPMMESVIQNLNLADVSANGLRGMLSITNKSGTRILQISATTRDPQLSADIANEVANLAITWLPAVMECNEPTHRAGPSYTRTAILGALVLCLLTYGVFVVQYLYDDSIRTEADMEKFFGVMPLAVIPEEGSALNRGETGRLGKKTQADKEKQAK